MSEIDVEDCTRRPSTAACPWCRPGAVYSYSWRPDGRRWSSVLWCDRPGCRSIPQTVAALSVTRAEAEAECLRRWSEQASRDAAYRDACAQVGGAA